jgi:hypothetical protein
MKLTSTFIIALLLTACAADPVNIQSVAEEEVSLLAAPTRPLSEYAEFELLDMTFSAAIRREPGKMREAREDESAFHAKIAPLLWDWDDANIEGASGKLIVETKLERLKVVSGGARFWAGAWAGDSYIDMSLRLIDASSGEVISQVLIRRNANAMTGAWSIGKSDQNLDQYVVSIVYQYLTDYYW